MSINQKYRAVFFNWDKYAFRDIHHADFMFIRETELLTLDEQVDGIDRLFRENDYVSEARGQDGAEIVTSVTLIENGKAWRQIVNRVKPDKFA